MAEVKDGDIRIFPYVGDIYLGVDPTGYSNKKSAQSYMKKYDRIPEEIIYSHFGGKEKYIRDHSTFNSLEKVNKGKDHWGDNIIEPLFVKKGVELSDDEYNVLIGLYLRYRELSEYISEQAIEKKEIQEKIESLGYDARGIDIWTSSYYAYEKKYISEHVEYREGIVHISVEFNGKLV